MWCDLLFPYTYTYIYERPYTQKGWSPLGVLSGLWRNEGLVLDTCLRGEVFLVCRFVTGTLKKSSLSPVGSCSATVEEGSDPKGQRQVTWLSFFTREGRVEPFVERR